MLVSCTGTLPSILWTEQDERGKKAARIPAHLRVPLPLPQRLQVVTAQPAGAQRYQHARHAAVPAAGGGDGRDGAAHVDLVSSAPACLLQTTAVAGAQPRQQLHVTA